MSTTNTMILCMSAAAIGLLCGARPVAAQQSLKPDASAISDFEEIIVTARRREEHLQTIPLAVTAFSQKTIEQKQIRQIHDLAQYVPSLAVSLSQSDSNGVFSSQVRLRGLPGVEIYFADVPLGDADFQNGTGIQHGLSPGFLYDLEDLEVVKGPQGTLFGKNSVGGLISIEPKHPTNDYEGYLRVGFGKYSDKEVEGAVNIPVVPNKLVIRIAGQMQQRNGYTEEEIQHKDLDNVSYYAWRIGITMRPTDDLQNYFLYDGYWQDSNGSGDIVSFINPKLVLSRLGSSFSPLPPNLTPAQIAQQCVAVVTLQGPSFGFLSNGYSGGCPNAKYQIGLYQQNLSGVLAQQQALGARAVIGDNFQNIGKDYFYGLTDVFSWDVDENMSVKNAAAARIFKQLSTDDYTPIGAALPILNIGAPGNNGLWGNNEAQYTEEIQLQVKSFSDKLTWVAGGFLEFDHPIGQTEIASAALGQSAAGTVSYYDYHIVSRSQAGFVHGDYDLANYVDGLKFTAGYRYTWDFISTASTGTSGSYTPVYNAAHVATNCLGSFLTDNNCYQSAPDAHYSSYGWNLSLEEQLTSDFLIYVRSGNAYRPGGSNLNVPADYANFGPEHVTDVEIGEKADWDLIGIHGRTNADIYNANYKAIQVQSLVDVTDASGKIHDNTINLNAASATIRGAEIEQTILAAKGLEVDFHASYNFSKYNQFPAAFNPAGTETPFLYIPKWQYGLTGTYHLPMDESLGNVAVSATYTWYGHQYDSASAGEIYLITPSYNLVNLRVDWINILGQSVDASFWMQNALNSTYVQGVVPVYTQIGFTSLAYGPPRMFGLNLKYRFGGSKSIEDSPTTTYVPPPAITARSL